LKKNILFLLLLLHNIIKTFNTKKYYLMRAIVINVQFVIIT